MTLTSAPSGERARLDGRVVATDLDRALELLEQAERARAEAATLLAGLQTTGLERFCGYVSWERLVAHRTACGNRASFALMRSARHLGRFARTASALAAGAIGLAHVEVLARAAAGLANAYERDEPELLALAERVEPEELERVCRQWHQRVDVETAANDAEHRFEGRGLWAQQAFDGSLTGRFSLDPIAGNIVLTALDTSPDPTDSIIGPRTLAQRRADRLTDLCAAALGTDDGDRASGPGTRATVDVMIDVETLAGADGPIDRLRAELARGAPIGGPGLDRLLCDASFRALVADGADVVLRYNRATPDIPPALRRAVRIRDRHCTFDGCDRPWNWCDLHHLVPRHRGGPTTVDNLTLLCRFHHGLVHEGGWQLTRAPDGAILTSTP